MKRFLSVLLLTVLLSVVVFAETADVDLDLTRLSGTLLTDRLAGIRADPETYAGKTLRVCGQYYAMESGESIQHSLIVCDECHCTEVGITMTGGPEAEILWPENNTRIEITATVEAWINSAGILSARLVVSSILPR